jgi:uncharacterized protein (TIGR03118 family)
MINETPTLRWLGPSVLTALSANKATVGALALILGAGLTALADESGKDIRAPEVPAEIAVPVGNKVYFHGFGRGVQIYTWTGSTWGPAVPDATLFDAEGNVVATHFAGPTWQSIDGSSVVGAVVPPTVIVDSNAIPWLLLRAVTTNGPGVFADTSYIHRVNTTGGKAPSADGAAVGQVARVPYTADYFFYRKTPSHANDDHSAFYRQVNLVSDQSGVALLQDTNLVNAWGTSFSPTSPFWVNDNGAGKATLYAVTNDSSGLPHVAKQSLEVSIPGQGNPTGQVFNNTTNFHGDVFLFVSEDGTVAGWRGALGTTAEVLATRANAVYKGVTLTSVAGVPFLLAANFSEGTVDVYDGNANLIGQLSDSHVPAGYAPFNVQSIGGTIFVTFARQDADKKDDVAGCGHGLIDVLDLPTQTFHRFVTGSDAGGHFKEINSPWGVAVAPSTFGKHADELLVGNFGSGTIMAFDERGHFKGFLESRSKTPVVIDGLWALTFGSGSKAGVPETLYFTAGPDDESHGLVGSLEPVRKHDSNERHHSDRH